MSKSSAPRWVGENEAFATAHTLRGSPRKLNLVAETIRGKPVSDALALLTFSPRRIAHDVKKVLQSAIANAENNHQLDVDRLVVSSATVGKTFSLKRLHARARGRASRIEKPFSNLTVVVRERLDQAKVPVTEADDAAETEDADKKPRTAAKRKAKAKRPRSDKTKGTKSKAKRPVGKGKKKGKT
jgi:large subunit ribosomal protein L22